MPRAAGFTTRSADVRRCRPGLVDGMGDRQEATRCGPSTGKLMLPGEKISGTSTSTRSAKRSPTRSKSASGSIRKARSRSSAGARLVPSIPGGSRGTARHSAELDRAHRRLHDAAGNTLASRTSSRTSICAARRCRSRRFCPDGGNADHQLRRQLQLQLDTNYIYADDAAPVFPKGTIIHFTAWYDNTEGQQEQPRSGSVGRLRRPHRRRDGARLDERGLSERRGLQGGNEQTQRTQAGGDHCGARP